MVQQKSVGVLIAPIPAQQFLHMMMCDYHKYYHQSDEMGKQSKKKGPNAVKSSIKEASSSAVSSAESLPKKLIELCENLGSPDESRRYRATFFLANLFLTSNTDFRTIRPYVTASVLTSLSLRLVDSSWAIKTCAAGAIRNLASHDNPHIYEILLSSELMEPIVLIISQAITDGCCAWADGALSADTNGEPEYILQLVNALVNLCANVETACPLVLEVNPDFLVSILEALQTARPTSQPYKIRDALAKLLLVMTDECVEAVENVVYAKVDLSFGAWLTLHCQKLSEERTSVGMDDLSLMGVAVNMASVQDGYFESQNETFVNILQLLPSVISHKSAVCNISENLICKNDSSQYISLAAEILTNLVAIIRPEQEDDVAEVEQEIRSVKCSDFSNEMAISICRAICSALESMPGVMIYLLDQIILDESDDTESMSDCLRQLLHSNDRLLSLVANLIERNHNLWKNLNEISGQLMCCVLYNSQFMIERLLVALEATKQIQSLSKVIVETAKSSLSVSLLLLNIDLESVGSNFCQIWNVLDKLGAMYTCLPPHFIQFDAIFEIYSALLAIMNCAANAITDSERFLMRSSADSSDTFIEVPLQLS